MEGSRPPHRTARALRYPLSCYLALLSFGAQSGVVSSAAPQAPVDIEPALRQNIDARVHAVMERTAVPSVSIALVRHARLVYAQAYGEAGLEPHRAAETSMRYAVGKALRRGIKWLPEQLREFAPRAA